MLAGATGLGSSLSILQAKAWALIKGLKGAAHLAIHNIVIEGVNLAVVNAVKSVWKITWEINNIVVDVGVQLARFADWRISHCYREANKAADFIAFKGHNYSSISVSSLLLWFSLIIHRHVLGWPPD